MNKHNSPFALRQQSGSTLIISLIFLAAVMMIGFIATMTSNTQYKLAGNLQFEDGAFNNAETAITAGEKWLSSGTNFNDSGFIITDAAKPNLYPIGTAPDPLGTNWSDANSLKLADISQRYFINLLTTGERLQGSDMSVGGRPSAGCDQVNTYLITARGSSARGAQRYLQSYYSVLSC